MSVTVTNRKTSFDADTNSDIPVAAENISDVEYQQIKLIDATATSTSPTGVSANPLHVQGTVLNDISTDTGILAGTVDDGAVQVKGDPLVPLVVSDGGGALSIDDAGGSLTVDGTVIVDDGGGALSIDDAGGSITVDGTVTVIQDGGATLAVEGTIDIAPLQNAGSGRKAVTTAGTAVALAGDTAIKSVTILAMSTNTDVVYVGGAAVDDAIGFPLEPKETVTLDIANLGSVFIDSEEDGDGVAFIYVS